MKENKDMGKTISESDTDKSNDAIKSNILQTDCSMIITGFGDNPYNNYAEYLRSKGYKIKHLNLENFEKSTHYNPFAYISSDDDIENLVNTIMLSTVFVSNQFEDNFWTRCERALLCALIAYLSYNRPKEEQNFANVKKLIAAGIGAPEDSPFLYSELDKIFNGLIKEQPECYAVKRYLYFRYESEKSYKTILISCSVRLQMFDVVAVQKLTDADEMELYDLNNEKMAVFVTFPEGYKTFNLLGNLLLSQAHHFLRSSDNNKIRVLLLDGSSMDRPSDLSEIWLIR